MNDEVEFEVRGRDDKWRVGYPDEGDMLTPFLWYDKNGDVKSVIYAGGDSGKLTETFEEFPTAKAAINYAKTYLGAEKIRLVKTREKKKKEKKYDPND